MKLVRAKFIDKPLRSCHSDKLICLIFCWHFPNKYCFKVKITAFMQMRLIIWIKTQNIQMNKWIENQMQKNVEFVLKLSISKIKYQVIYRKMWTATPKGNENRTKTKQTKLRIKWKNASLWKMFAIAFMLPLTY